MPGIASRLLTIVRPHFTPIRYRKFAQYIKLMPTSPIMADSLKSSLSQTRVLSESEVDEPAHKKMRLDDHGKEASIDSAMEDPIASTSQSTKNNGFEKRSKKNKKRKEPPLPELCSTADVLYQEIRSILGGGVVDAVTSEGGAFKSPYSRGDEVEVTIDRMTAGGKFKGFFYVGTWI
jgi:tRNA (uracil-5-)-methyltransferase